MRWLVRGESRAAAGRAARVDSASASATPPPRLGARLSTLHSTLQAMRSSGAGRDYQPSPQRPPVRRSASLLYLTRRHSARGPGRARAALVPVRCRVVPPADPSWSVSGPLRARFWSAAVWRIRCRRHPSLQCGRSWMPASAADSRGSQPLCPAPSDRLRADGGRLQQRRCV